MISFERQNEILELLKEYHTVTVEFLCRKLFASGATIRRDLTEMAQKGLLERVRGGATLVSGTNQDPPLFVRSQKEKEKKRYIAQLASRLLSDHMTVFLDSSSTVTSLAYQIFRFKNLSIVTNGIETANVLNDNTSFKLFLCGGLIKDSSSLVGSLAHETLDHFRADMLFFSCCGLSQNGTVTEASEEASAIKQVMIRNSKKKVLLCDSTKFGQEYFCKSCTAKDIDLIVTDQAPQEAFLRSLEQKTKIIFPK